MNELWGGAISAGALIGTPAIVTAGRFGPFGEFGERPLFAHSGRPRSRLLTAEIPHSRRCHPLGMRNPDCLVRLVSRPTAWLRTQDEDAREVGLGRQCLRCPPRRCGFERLVGLDGNRKAARGGLVAPDDHVDVERIELETPANAASRLGVNEGRTGASKTVDDDVVAIGHVEDRVLEQDARLDRQVEIKAFARVGPRRRASGIGPDIRPPPSVASEFEIVD